MLCSTLKVLILIIFHVIVYNVGIYVSKTKQKNKGKQRKRNKYTRNSYSTELDLLVKSK